MTTVHTCACAWNILEENTTWNYLLEYSMHMQMWYSQLEYSMHMFELLEHVYIYIYMYICTLSHCIYEESFVISYSSNLTFYIR